MNNISMSSSSAVSLEGWENCSESGISTGESSNLGAMAGAEDGMDAPSSPNQGLTAGLGLVGATAGVLGATTVAGGVAALCATVIAVLKVVEVVADDHKQNGQPVKDPMARNAPIDKR